MGVLAGTLFFVLAGVIGSCSICCVPALKAAKGCAPRRAAPLPATDPASSAARPGAQYAPPARPLTQACLSRAQAEYPAHLDRRHVHVAHVRARPSPRRTPALSHPMARCRRWIITYMMQLNPLIDPKPIMGE